MESCSAQKERFKKKKKKRADSPEEDRLSLPDCDIVHHSVVRLRIPLAPDGQPCGHKKQNPQTEQKCAFGEGDKVSAQRHRFEAEGGKRSPQQDRRSPLYNNGPGQINQSSPNPDLLQVAARCAQTRSYDQPSRQRRARFHHSNTTIIREHMRADSCV